MVIRGRETVAVVGVILVAIGILIAYEAVKGGLNSPAEATGGTGSSNMIPSSQGIQSPGQWQQLLEGQGLPANIVQTFMGIINRESGGNAGAICFAPSGPQNELQCTSYPKAGDTQGAFGPFQFLNSTWNGLGCYPPAPSDPLAINTAAFDPGASVSCAAKAFTTPGVGLTPWGF